MKQIILLSFIVFTFFNCSNNVSNQEQKVTDNIIDANADTVTNDILQLLNNEQEKTSKQEQVQRWVKLKEYGDIEDVDPNIENLILLKDTLSIDSLNIGYFKGLKGLDMSGQGFQYLPRAIGELNRLEVLIAHRNRISEITNELCSLGELRELYLESNELLAIPSCIGSLEKLEVLLLSDNKLQFIPEEIGELKELETIEAVGNLLDSLPMGFYQLVSLKHCNLQGNNIGKLSGKISNLKNLEYLDISSNNLKQLPKEIYELKKLKVLRLKSNFISMVDIKSLKEALPGVTIK